MDGLIPLCSDRKSQKKEWNQIWSMWWFLPFNFDAQLNEKSGTSMYSLKIMNKRKELLWWWSLILLWMKLFDGCCKSVSFKVSCLHGLLPWPHLPGGTYINWWTEMERNIRVIMLLVVMVVIYGYPLDFNLKGEWK